MRRSLWIVLLLALVVMPRPAYAWDLGSFDDGLRDFVGESQTEIEQDDEPRLVLGAGSNESGNLGFIQNVINSCSRIPWLYGANANPDGLNPRQFILQVLKGSLGNNSPSARSPVVLAVGLVFMWWGVRKSVSMIMAAWRRGRAST